MAEIFKKAYDQADRMLNGSGLSSIMFDISDWSMGGDLLGGGLTPKQAQGMTNYIYGKDPGADDRIGKSLQRFAIQKMNQPGGRDYSEEEILSDYYKDYPIPPDMIKKYYESLNDNGSGLSSIVHRQDGGDLSGWDMGDWAEAQMAADTGSRGGDVLTTEDFSHVSSDDIQSSPDPNYGKKELQYLKHQGDTRPKGPPSSRMYKDWRNPNFLYDRYEKDAVERNKLYDSTYGGMKPKTPFTNTGYKGLGRPYMGYFGSEGISPWAMISKEQAKYMTGVKKDSLGNLYVTKDTLAFMEGQEEIEKAERERQAGYAKSEKSLEADEKKHSEIEQKIKDENLMEKFLKDPNLYLWNRAATGGKVMPRGLSGINKSININGQPHSLAWINPGEASALRAMGGSGKKVNGIPAYYYGSWGADVDDLLDTDVPEAYNEVYDLDPPRTERGQVQTYGMQMPQLQQGSPEQSPTSEPYYGQRWDEPTVVDAKGIADLYADVHGTSIYDIPGHGEAYATQGPSATDADISYTDYELGDMGGYSKDQISDFKKSREKRDYGDEDEYQRLYDDPRLNVYKTELINRLGGPGMEAYMRSMGPAGLREMISKWETGYDFGGPMGTMEGIQRAMAESYSDPLKKLIKEDKAIEEYNIDEDKYGMGPGTPEDYARFNAMDIGKIQAPEVEAAKTRFQGILDNVLNFIGSRPAGKEPQYTTTQLIKSEVEKIGGEYTPVDRDPSAIGGLVNYLVPSFLSNLMGGDSIGTITKGGITFNVSEDGTVTPIDNYYSPDEGPDPVTRKPRPIRKASISEEVDKPLTGIAKLIASIKDKKHLLPQFKNIVAAGFSEQEAADMLGVPLADMLDASSDTFIT